MKMKTILIIGLCLVFSVSLEAQYRAVSGNVTVFENLTLTNIRIKAQKAGTQTQTDSLGNFTLVCNEKDVLIAKGKAFYTVRKKVSPETDSVRINMRFLENPENVKMAVGYGYITREQSTYAYANLNNSQENFCSYTDIFELIRGKCPGVQVNTTSNSPGAEQEILIRGKKSLTLSNNVLYVVDGIITSEIGHISPCIVKSISFLKDASASIYGSRGANGVVIIETKNAKNSNDPI
ncbi:MAG TPA: TonB-dependent receptor plug domain-containing protein [Prolixibacteraceae bacterium]|nr:TonB-dependent receptor plug domain-containing protein [Prolixibacteraceae bacterium]